MLAGPNVLVKIFVTDIKSANPAHVSLSIDLGKGFWLSKILKITYNNEVN